MDVLANMWLYQICIAVTISFFLAIFQGSLVSTWMLINSMQLMAHVPLISDKLPANAHYFLLNFLSLVRLNIEGMGSSLDQLDLKLKEYMLITEENSGFS